MNTIKLASHLKEQLLLYNSIQAVEISPSLSKAKSFNYI